MRYCLKANSWAVADLPRQAPSCTRSNAAIFCMSLRATFLPPRTRPSFCMSLRTASLHTQKRLCLLHVIANRVLAHAEAPLPSACHCEPVRTLVWQSASPQKCLASWQLFRQTRYALRICQKYCFPLCATARRTDCRVASLLAMTEGEACHCEPRLCNRAHVLPSACHCEPVQNGNRGAPVRPGEGDAAERLKTWIFLRKSRGEGCAACIAEVWQSASPQRNLARW